MKRTATRAHRSTYPNPISFQAGDRLLVGGRKSTEYPGWAWIRTADGNAGWAPGCILELGDGDTARATEDYTARELDTEPGEVFSSLRELNGWAWVRNERGDEGWIPIDTTRANPG